MIWVDDGSTDGTREWLRSLPPEKNRILFNERNLGFSAANNAGALIAKGEFLAFLNNDLVLTSCWSKPLIQAVVNLENIGVVGNVQVNPATQLVDHAGIRFELSGIPYHHGKGSAPEKFNGGGGFFTAITAACWLVRKDTFLKVGGFDTGYRNGCEDVDLCLKLSALDYRHWVSYDSRVYHHVSSSPGRKDHDRRNLAIFLKKWGTLTSQYGQRDWPLYYIRRILRNPRQVNGTKLMDALLRVVKLRSGDSKWANARRIAAMDF